jgi:hypothetical protein
MPSAWVLRRVTLVKSGVSKEFIASTVTVTGIGELGTLDQRGME